MFRVLLIVFLYCFLLTTPVFAAEGDTEGSSGSILWGVAGAAVAALAGTGVTALVKWLKTLGIVKKLGIENLIDKAGEVAIHYAESWGRQKTASSAEKLNAAKEVFEAELAKKGLKLDAGDMQKRLESIFNKIKDQVEHKPAA